MAFPIPSMVLKQLYTRDSLKNSPQGVRFSLKNRLTDTKVTGLQAVSFDGREVPLSAIHLVLSDGGALTPDELKQQPIDFPLRRSLEIICKIEPLALGMHKIEIKFEASTFGALTLKVDGAIQQESSERIHIPRDSNDDYGQAAIRKRQEFIADYTGKKLEHLPHYSFDPQALKGNIENFTGVAQVPIGFAGPLTINGEHAQGDFIVPMATTEGTLVASYNRGMKVLNLSGGVKVTVSGDSMQRAPVFVFDDAVAARTFVKWVDDNLDKIREEAESTSSVAKLQYVDPYLGVCSQSDKKSRFVGA
jgi:hydroxymethylglutaryl-CoA reductase (NADPH)